MEERKLNGKLALAIVLYLIDVGGMERIDSFYEKYPGPTPEWVVRREDEFFDIQQAMWRYYESL